MKNPVNSLNLTLHNSTRQYWQNYLKNLCELKMENIIKDIITPLKSERVSFSIDTNLMQRDFLNVSFNLEMDNFLPYRKPNNTPLYIHFESDHPPSITKNCHRWIADVFQICHAMKINSTRLNFSTNHL